jgi:metallo-beta-lactamase family protein
MAPDPKNAVILSGYQAGGTRGAALAAGAKELRIYGQDVPIQAEVVQIEGFSAHADGDEIIRWMRTASRAPRMTYVTHCDPDASDALRIRIKRELGWKARVPEYLEAVPLENPH